MISAATAAAIAAFPHRLVRTLARLGLVGLVLLSTGFTIFSTWVSTYNYPGGDVWQVLETINIPENGGLPAWRRSSNPQPSSTSLRTRCRLARRSSPSCMPTSPPRRRSHPTRSPRGTTPRTRPRQFSHPSEHGTQRSITSSRRSPRPSARSRRRTACLSGSL